MVTQTVLHDEVLTIKEAAALTGRHEMTIANALRAGELRGQQRKRGARWFVRRADVLAWLAPSPTPEEMSARGNSARKAPIADAALETAVLIAVSEAFIGLGEALGRIAVQRASPT